jgi:hypothetical protein
MLCSALVAMDTAMHYAVNIAYVELGRVVKRLQRSDNIAYGIPDTIRIGHVEWKLCSIIRWRIQ